jgi:endonuclease G
VVLEQTKTNLPDITAETRVIAVNLPNINGIKGANWRKYRVSVDQIEQLTNYNLLSNLPTSVQQAIESRVDQQ